MPKKVLAVEHYTDHLFRFRMTRPAGFRFRSGEFAMIGFDGWRKANLPCLFDCQPRLG